MNTNTAAFIATARQELSQCMAKAHQALEDRKPATVGDMLDALNMIAIRIEAYRVAKPESTHALGQLLEDVAQARSALTKELRDRFTPMSPNDLPAGVTARSMAHPAGPCYAFHHDVLGELGRIVLIPVGATHIELRAEIHEDSRGKGDRENLFREVVNSIGRSLQQLAPRGSH